MVKVADRKVPRDCSVELPLGIPDTEDPVRLLSTAWKKREVLYSSKQDWPCIPRTLRSTWLELWQLILMREVKLELSRSHFYDLLMLVGVAALLGFTRSFNDDQAAKLPQASYVFSMGMGLVLMSLGSYMLAEDGSIRQHEAFSGMNMVAYFLAKTSYGLVKALIGPLIFLFFYHLILTRRLTSERRREWLTDADWLAFHLHVCRLTILVSFICQSICMILSLLAGGINLVG